MADTNTIIGESILVKGNLEGDEDLTVQGRVEGSINLTRTIIIEPGGVIKAEVSVANAIVSGVMVGNISATDSVELTETGRMLGDIQAPRVIINEGALFKGQVDMGDLEMARSRVSKTAQSSYQPSYTKSPAPTRPANRPVARPEPPKPQEQKPKVTPKPAPKPTPKPATPPKKPAVVAVAGASKRSKKKVILKKKKRR